MRVLAIDPGYERMGAAVLESATNQHREKLIYSTCIITRKQEEFSARLLQLGQAFEQLIKEYQPELIAIEKLFFATNQKTASAVSEVRGMLLYLSAKNKVPVVEYTPPQIKQTVTGYGQAGKAQVIQMVRQLVTIPPGKRYDDEYDAIGIGLTALARAKFE